MFYRVLTCTLEKALSITVLSPVLTFIPKTARRDRAHVHVHPQESGAAQLQNGWVVDRVLRLFRPLHVALALPARAGAAGAWR